MLSTFDADLYARERPASPSMERVLEALSDGDWRSVDEIARMTGDTKPTIRASLQRLEQSGRAIQRTYAGDELMFRLASLGG